MVVVRSRSRNRIKESKLINISLTVGGGRGTSISLRTYQADGRRLQGAEETDPLAPLETPSVLSYLLGLKHLMVLLKVPPPRMRRLTAHIQRCAFLG